MTAAGCQTGIGTARGFDELLSDSLGIDNAGFVVYTERQKPGYLQLEARVKEHARNLTRESVAAFNHTILTRDMNADMAGKRRKRLGIAGPAFAHAGSLNDIDDWDQEHRRLTSSVSLSPAGGLRDRKIGGRSFGLGLELAGGGDPVDSRARRAGPQPADHRRCGTGRRKNAGRGAITESNSPRRSNSRGPRARRLRSAIKRSSC